MADDLRHRLARVRAIAEEAASLTYTGGPGDRLLPPEAVLGRRILAALDDTEQVADER